MNLRTLSSCMAGFTLAASAFLHAEGPAPLIILDTDFRSDCDDAGTLAMVHALQDLGRVELIGAIATTTGPHVVAAMDAVNTFYGRPDVPIGIITAGGGLNTTVGSDDFAPTLANTSLYVSDQTNATAPNSTVLYRQLLHAAANGSVKIVVVGAQTAIHRLMESAANHAGDGIPLTGQQLIAAKVSELAIMGGIFNGSSHLEWNITLDVNAAQQVARHWSTPVVYSGFEIGNNIMTGAALTNPAVNPVAKAYQLYSGTTGGAGTIGNRQSWDQTTALYAVVGTNWNGDELWELSEPHNVDFESNGRTVAVPDGTTNRRYLKQSDAIMTNAGLASIISGLMTQAPANQGPAPVPPVRVGTLARWTFEEGQGTAAADSSGRGYGGILRNFANTASGVGDTTTSGWTSDGRLRFDGANDHVETPLPTSQISGGSFTLEAVVRYEGTSGRAWTPILGSSHGPSYSANQILFVGKNTGDNQLNLNLAGLAAFNVNSGGLFNGQEHHLAVVFDSAAAQIRIYVDEGLIHTRNNVSASYAGTSTLWLGAVGHSTTERWVGWIGDVRISDVALAPAQFLTAEPTASPYSLWAAERQLTGEDALPGADPDGNGVVNLLEFAFGIGQGTSGRERLPQGLRAVVGDAAYFSIGFWRRTGNAGIQYLPSFSGNLLGTETFQDVGLPFGDPVPDGSGFEWVTYRDPVPMADAPQRFGRVGVALE